MLRAGISLQQLMFLFKQQHTGTVPAGIFVLQVAFSQEYSRIRVPIHHSQFMQQPHRFFTDLPFSSGQAFQRQQGTSSAFRGGGKPHRIRKCLRISCLIKQHHRTDAGDTIKIIL